MRRTSVDTGTSASPVDVDLICKRRTCLGLLEANEALQEALAMARLSGQFVVKIYDTFLSKDESLPNEGVYFLHLVMEYW